MSGQGGGASIRVGSRVSAHVGDLGYWNGSKEHDSKGKKRRRGKQRLFGTVSASKPNRTWLVRWDQTGVASEEERSSFELKHGGAGTDPRPTNQEVAAAMQQRQQARQLAGAPANAVVQERAPEEAAAPPEETTRAAEQREQPREAAAP